MKNIIFALVVFASIFVVEAEVLNLGFENGTNPGWKFYLGHDEPGAQGSFVVLPEPVGIPALRAGRLEAATRLGGWYTTIAISLPKPIMFKSITFKIRTLDFSSFGVRYNDASGQTHQVNFNIAPSDEWQDVKLTVPEEPNPRHWGGNNDGIIHQGIVNLVILAEGVRHVIPHSGHGYLFINSVQVEY